MSFAVLCIAALAALGIVAAIASRLDHGDDEVTIGHDCSSCTAADEGSCQLHCLMEEKKKRECADSQHS